MARYLVTGAGGFIGSAVANRLIAEGNEVVVIDNLSTGYYENIPKSAIFVKGDCANPKIYDKIPQDSYEAIFHIAGQSSGEISFDDPIYDIKTNTESTLLLLKFAKKNGCNRFIYASTMSVYGVQPNRPIRENDFCNPESFYGIAKLASEHYLRIYRNYGINSTSLRLFNVYGPGQDLQNLRQGMVSIFLSQILKDKKILVKGSKDRFRDFIYIDDVVEAFVRCLTMSNSYNEIINIGTGIKTTVAQLINQLVSNYDIEIPVIYKGGTSGDIFGIYSDQTKMNKSLGAWHKIDLEMGIKKFNHFYKQN